MQRREKILLALLLGAVIAWQGRGIVRGVFLGRLDDRWDKVKVVNETNSTLVDKETKLLQTMKRMGEWKNRSLPPDALEALRLYQQWLTDLGQTAAIAKLHIAPEQRQGTGPGFKTASVKITGEGTFDQLTTFLHEFQRIAMLHRIASLKVEEAKAGGGPLKFTMVAEGMLLEDSAPRTRLLARTTLADSLPRSFDTVKVVSSEGFPTEPGFSVRIDKEFVVVTKIDGNNWTITRAVDGTTKTGHNRKAEVEFNPVRAERKDIKLEDVRKSLVANPFVKPGPTGPPTIDPNDPARQTRLMASVSENEDQAAYLYNGLTKTQTVVRKGTEISVGDIQGTVVAVEPKYIHIKRGNDVYQLNIGKDLRSMPRADDLGGGADMMDTMGDMPVGAPSFGGRAPVGGPGVVRDGGNADGNRGNREGGGGFRSRRSRGPDSLPGEE
jgi:hypothetical protein